MYNETPQHAAERLAANQIKNGFEFQALHEYCDAEGRILYWRIRIKHPASGEKWIRPMYRNEKDIWVLGHPKLSYLNPLYRLVAIIQRSDESVWITEGEWCADHLAKFGILSTTSGGAESANRTDWRPLANRKIIIWRDNDGAGNRYAETILKQLQALNCNVQLVDVAKLNLAIKGDCVDWLAAHPNATKQDIEALPFIEVSSQSKDVPSQPEIIVEDAKQPTPSTPVSSSSHPSYSFQVNNSGVWYNDNENVHWVCSKLEIKALVRDKDSKNWGRLLEFFDADGKLHTWAMPMEMLGGRGDELRYELLRQGMEISPNTKMRNLLIEYITITKPEARARCVTHTGWYNHVFVLPDTTIGETTEQVLYQAENYTCDYQQLGTLEQWQNEISTLCAGNSRLVLAVSVAFAAMLLHPAGIESGGIHFVGSSSSGKTTALRVAASVYGAPDYLHRWRATTNGLEAVAATRSDTLLILDELAQVEPKEAGEIAYMLANGSGKARASRNGTAKTRHEWRLLFLSAGEIGLAQHMREAGKKTRSGQEVRLVDIAADAEAGLGIFEKVPEASTAAELSRQLMDATQHFYGEAAIAFLRYLAQCTVYNHLAAKIKQFSNQFIKTYLPANASGQVHRVCERFALIAFAGELATTLSITGWKTEEATQAAITCFNTWLEQRGGVRDQERTTVLSQVKSFLEAHGESRFSDWSAISSHTMNRAGFKKTDNEGTQFYVLPEAFREELCAGHEPRTVARILMAENWIIPEADGKPYRREYLPLIGRSRCYVFTQKVWEG